MRRLLAMLEKEARQHTGLVLGLALLVLPVQALVLFGTSVAPESLTLFEAHAVFMRLFVPLFGLLLGNRLVVAEYRERTQLFIEALPVRRWEMVLLKWVLGALGLAALSVLGLAATAAIAVLREPVTASHLGIMLARSLAWAFGVWGFLFAVGFTGRFRLAIYLALALGLMAASSAFEVDLARVGIFAVVDSTLAIERETLPLADVLSAFGLGAACTLVGIALALVSDGSIAESLARRMSAREKSAVGALALIGLVVVTTLEGKKKPEPYAFPEGTPVVTGTALPIEVAFGSESERAAAAELVTELERELGDLPRRLGWRALPKVRVSASSAFDGRTFEPVRLGTGDGVLVRAAFDEPDFDAVGFRTAVVRALLVAHTDGRAEHEPYAVFLDGWARWFAETDAPADERRRTLLRALHATRHGAIDERALARWHETRERIGPQVAEALASTLLLTMAEARGADAVDAAARELFGRAPPSDARVWLERLADPPTQIVARHAGLSFADLIARWNASLELTREEPWAREALAGVPDYRGEIAVDAVEGELRLVRGELASSSPPPADTVASLVHHSLGPFDEPMVELELERVEVGWPAGQRARTARLEGRYGPGERAFLALEVESAELGCPIRLVAERRTVR